MLITAGFPFVMSCRSGGGRDPAASNLWIEKKAGLEAFYGVPIVFDEVEFPSHWSVNNPHFTPISEEGRFNALVRLEVDLSKYTAAFLQKYLTRIYLVSTLRFDGQIYGGTNDLSHRWLYLTLNSIGDNGHSHAIGFHHEFSSILYKANRSLFPESSWKACNPPDFQYVFDVSSSLNIASQKTGTRGNAATYLRGFMCEYGELTLEDDINTYSQFLIAKPDQLVAISEEYPIVKQKVELLYKFYQAIGYSG